MPAPVLPTNNNLDQRTIDFHILEQLQYMAELAGSDAPPSIPNINNFDPRNLGYEHIVQLRAFNVSVEDGATQYRNTIIISAAVKTLAAANIELVTAPPTGFARVPVSAHMFLFHAGTNDFIQTNATDHLALLYNGGAEITELGSAAQLTTLLETSASAALFVEFGIPYGATPAGFVPEVDAAIDLDNNGAAEYTGNAGSDNTLSLRIGYKNVPMSAFS